MCDEANLLAHDVLRDLSRTVSLLEAQIDLDSACPNAIKMLLEAMPFPAGVKDEAGRMLHFNQAASDTWGLKLDQYQGRTMREYNEVTQRVYMNSALESDERALQSSHPIVGELPPREGVPPSVVLKIALPGKHGRLIWWATFPRTAIAASYQFRCAV